MANPGANYTVEIIMKQRRRHEDNIRRALRIHGPKVTRKLTNTIKSSRGSGVKYPQLPNRSSAPGEIPVSQSGKLANSFGYITRVNELSIFNKARSKTGAPYPLFLNIGTRKMEPRQYFDNTIEAMAGLLFRDLLDLY